MSLVGIVIAVKLARGEDIKPRKWFKEQDSLTPRFLERLRWPAGEALRALALNLTTSEPDPRLTYIIIRAWNDTKIAANVDGWPEESEERGIAQWLEPTERTKEGLRAFVGSLETEGGALVVRDVEKIPSVRKAARRVARSMGRSVWGHDVVNVFHTKLAETGSYGWHFDRSDNFLYCLGGVKRFRVAGREPRSKLVLDAQLGAAGAMYVPRKLYHNGIGGAGGSTLVSIALKPYRASRERRWRRWRRRRNRVIKTFFSPLGRSSDL